MPIDKHSYFFLIIEKNRFCLPKPPSMVRAYRGVRGVPKACGTLGLFALVRYPILKIPEKIHPEKKVSLKKYTQKKIHPEKSYFV